MQHSGHQPAQAVGSGTDALSGTLEQIVEQSTQELKQAKTRLEAILNNTTDGIVLSFPGRGIEQQNSTFNTLFACEPDDYFG